MQLKSLFSWQIMVVCAYMFSCLLNLMSITKGKCHICAVVSFQTNSRLPHYPDEKTHNHIHFNKQDKKLWFPFTETIIKSTYIMYERVA